MNYPVNEWSPLKKVIVGTASGAKIPQIDTSMRCVNYADVADTSTIKVGHYPQQVIDEANEDLETFVDFLRGESVEVLRPNQLWPTEYYDYCPRDVIVAVGDIAMAAPMPIKARKHAWRTLRQCFSNDGLNITPNVHSELDMNHGCVGNPDILALNENRPMFDAANVLKSDGHLLYLVSNSGNLAGAQYLQDTVEHLSIKVKTLSGVYSYMHIDSTIAFLREGLMLCNPSRIKDISVLPEPWCKWQVIWCDEPTDIGHYPGYCNASTWINMNLFSVSETLVVLEENQHSLRKQLEAHGIDCAMLPMRQQRTLGGGFHCVTLDLERKCG